MLYAFSVRTEHIHIVLAIAAELSPEKAMNTLKSWITRRMAEQGLVPQGNRVWARHGGADPTFHGIVPRRRGRLRAPWYRDRQGAVRSARIPFKSWITRVHGRTGSDPSRRAAADRSLTVAVLTRSELG
jgi:hypothetical protein